MPLLPCPRHALLAPALSVLLTSAALAAPRYTVTEIPTLGGTRNSAYDLNNRGWVVGWSETGSGTGRGFVWRERDDSLTTIGASGGHRDTTAYGINEAGQVVGYSRTYGIGTFRDDAFVWQSGQLSPRGRPDGHTGHGYAYAINAQGESVGSTRKGAYAGADPSADVARGGQVTALNVGPPAVAWDINDRGAIVGQAGNALAFLMDGGSTTWIRLAGGAGSGAYALNEQGVVVGWSHTATANGSGYGMRHAFVHQGGITTDLGVLDGKLQSYAHDVNEHGIVVGYAADRNFEPDAFVVRHGRMHNLNALIDPALGWSLDVAQAVNDRGQIVGQGVYQGQTRAFLLTPVRALPEPAPALLAVTGLAALLGWRRARRARLG